MASSNDNAQDRSAFQNAMAIAGAVALGVAGVKGAGAIKKYAAKSGKSPIKAAQGAVQDTVKKNYKGIKYVQDNFREINDIAKGVVRGDMPADLGMGFMEHKVRMAGRSMGDMIHGTNKMKDVERFNMQRHRRSYNPNRRKVKGRPDFSGQYTGANI